MLILIVILGAWLSLACLVVAACRSAARGDAAMERATEQVRRRATLAGVVLWEQPDELTAEDRRATSRPTPPVRGRPLVRS